MASQGKKRAKAAKGKAVRPRRKSISPARDSNGLTPQQARFVEEYLVDLNGTKAAIRAGYAPKAATACASRLLTVANVKAAVEAGKARRAQRVEISADFVLSELAKIARADLRQVARWGGTAEEPRRGVELIASEELTDDAAASIESVAMTENGPKISQHSKTRALELLGKHLGLFVDRVKIDNPEEIARGIAAAQKAIEGGAAFPAPPSEVAA